MTDQTDTPLPEDAAIAAAHPLTPEQQATVDIVVAHLLRTVTEERDAALALLRAAAAKRGAL
jgi:hypothetical protein